MNRPPEADKVRALARVLDTAVRIPGTSITIGLDPIIGLVPGVGDFAGALLSGYIVLASARLGVPPAIVARMIMNLGVDTVVGAVPLAGDLFDVGFRANTRNAALLDRHLADPDRTIRSSRLAIAGAAAGIVLLAVAGIGLALVAVHGLNLLVGKF